MVNKAASLSTLYLVIVFGCEGYPVFAAPLQKQQDIEIYIDGKRFESFADFSSYLGSSR